MRTQTSGFLFVAALGLGASLSAQNLVRVSDTGAHVRTWTQDGVEKGAFSRDGGATWIALPDSNYSLNWRERSFDPLVGDSGIAPTLAASESNELFYVQFVTDIIPEYAEALAQLGAISTRYYPNQAYIVRMPRASVDAVREQPYVRAVMDLAVGHKLDPELQVGLLAGELEEARYNIMVVNKHQDAAVLEARIMELGGTLEALAEGGIIVEATLAPTELLAVAQENTVLWIDRWSAPQYDMDKLRIQAGVDYVEIMAGMDGKGMRGHVNEGVHATHPEFAAIPPYRTAPLSLMGSSSSSHGTNTAGEIYAQGLPGGVKGILPFAQMIYSPSVSSRYPLVQALVDPGQVYKAMMMTQSWGGFRTTNYTTTSAMLDDILFDFDHMFATNSQSNAGARPSRPEAWAKNVAGIGGFLHRDNTDPTDDCWCFTGSIGPAADGRVGVTFAAYYDSIRTTSLSSGYSNTFGGTSGATPIVNGLAGGALQMFTDGLFGYPGGGWETRFNRRPNLTTTRTLLSLGTRQLSFTGSNSATRVQQGWGLPNLQDLYDNKDNLLLLDEEDVLSTGQFRDYFVFVKPGTAEFRVSMHHIEDEAVPSANPTRINSLDLLVLAPDGALYRGNGNGILNGPWSAPGGEANDVDIHENVFVQNPGSGLWQVRVQATAVRQDSHKETGAVDADFALAIRGIGGGRDTSGMTVDLVSDSAGQLDVDVSGAPAGGWATGYTIVSLDTARHLSLGDTFGLELDALGSSLLTTAPSAGNVFAFTPTANPALYPNATFSFSPSIAALAQGLTLDAVVVLLDASGNVVDVSNVDRVTVQ